MLVILTGSGNLCHPKITKKKSDSEASAMSDHDDVVMKGADADVVMNKNDATTYFQAADPANAKSAAENDDPEGVPEPEAT